MLNDHYADLLPEWLALVASKNLRAPVEYLPALLDLGVNKAEQREAISKVIGQRGQWLAQQNIQWGYVNASSDDAALWQTGIKPQRVSLLSKLRQKNPNQARELLQSTWSQEVASDRWAFVQTFRIGLSMADEPFLEEALDDRAKDVRAVAAELLKQLPKSRLCARMTERLKEFIQWKGGKKVGFTVTLPDDCSKEMVRDGVQGKATQGAQVIGEKSLWLTQIANAVPLSAWEALCEKTEPEKIVQVAARSKDWAVLLLGGLSASAARDGDLVWVEALLGEDKVPARHALFAALPINKKEQYILKLLTAKLSVKQGETVTPYIFGAQHPWSKKLSQKILDALFQDLTSDGIKYSYQLASLLELLVRHLHPSLIPITIARLPGTLKEKSPMAKEIEKVIAKIQFRKEMIDAVGRGHR